MNNEIKEIIVGIDLGTTNSCIAYFDQGSGTVKVIPALDTGSRTSASAVVFDKEGKRIIGNGALQSGGLYADIIISAKSFVGMPYSTYIKLNNETPFVLPYDIIEGKDGRCKIRFKRK